MFVGQLCCFQQGSASVYIVLGETSQGRKCLTDTQMWTSNCINIKDGRGIGGLRGFKETVLAGKMKTNMASKAANQELKIESVLAPPLYFTNMQFFCSLTPAWKRLLWNRGLTQRCQSSAMGWLQGSGASLCLIQHVTEAVTLENPVSTQRPLCSLPAGKTCLFFAH